MIINVIRLRRSDKRRQLALGAALASLTMLIAAPAMAQDEVVRGRTPDMRDVASTPVTDLNLKRDEIPELLQQAVVDPYADGGLSGCADVAVAISDLDRLLGPDIDIADKKNGLNFGKVAQSAVGSFIPFRGIIRELSGAAAHQRNFQTAIFAGAVRRGYLKGLGQQMGCAYPARPAFERVSVTKDDRMEVTDTSQTYVGEDGVTYVGNPVVQGD